MLRILLRVATVLVLAVIVALVVTALWIGIASQQQIERRYAVEATEIPVPADSVSRARGEHLFRSISCSLCHGEDGGGSIYFQSAAMGTVVGSNLTSGRGGTADQRSNLDWARAIRHGVKPDSTSLLVMPSEVFVHLNDSDLGAILAYLRSLPPVDRELPTSKFGPMGRVLLATGRMNLLVASKTPPFQPPPPAEPGPTPEYGRYLADISGCHGCHGFGLSGGAVAGPPGLPPASNLTPTGLGHYSEADFRRALREGVRPGGAPIDEFMPWRAYQHLTDKDVAALWAYLRSVPPRPFGGK